MTSFDTLAHEVVGFLGIGHWLSMMVAGDYSSLRTYEGFTAAVGPLLPSLLIFEVVRSRNAKNFDERDFKLIFLTYLLNRILSSYITVGALAFSIGFFHPYALFQSHITWYWLAYGYVVWELGHFIFHFSAHKVRLLWCLHSTHHSPESMSLLVSHAHFFLEAPYINLIRTAVCMLLGVSPPVLFIIISIDAVWGAFIHAGENIIKDGRMGFLNRLVLTPSHHRVHHARNPLYIDTNFCNLLNIWDRVFGTLQDEQEHTRPEYGITRVMRPGSFWDFYFGELGALFTDVKRAPGLVNKVAYIVMPPGWSHTGRHKTATALRRELLAKESGTSAQKAGEPGVNATTE